MKKHLFTSVLILSLICLCYAQSNYYVAINGNDSNPGTKTQPFHSIERAQQEIISLRNKNGGKLPSSVQVLIGEGTYYVSKTLNFGTLDSGDVNTPVTYSAEIGANVVISGGMKVTGWTSQGNNKWQVSVGNKEYVRQLWINNDRVPVAQTPTLEYVSVGTPNSDYIKYKPGDINPNWYNFNDIEVVLYHSWTASIHQIKSISTSNNTLYLKNTANTQWDESASGKRYYLRNVLEFLQPGQFYYDVVKGILHYYARNAQNPNNIDCVIPQIIELATINGANGQKARYINFENIVFSHTSIDVSDCFSGSCDAQSAAFLRTATVHLTNAEYIKFTGCSVAHVGGYGLWIDSGSSYNVVERNHIYDLGAGGIRIGINRGGVISPSLSSLFNTVNDSLLEDGGNFYEEGCGVLQQTADNSIIAHNEIRYFKYTGVSIGWTWEYAATSVKNNFVGWNHIHHIGLSYLSDMGCIYSLGISPGTQVYNNICHDIETFNYGGWGLYTDQASSFITLKNNIIYNTKCAGIHQHFGENNLFTNNIIAFSADDLNAPPHCNAAVRSSQWSPGSGIGDHSSFTFKTNILYIDVGNLFLSTQKFGFVNMTFDSNVYWSTQKGSNLQFPPSQAPVSFEEWKKEGKDVNSVLQDPLFVDPTNHNFNLKPNSPALKLGFVNIDTSQVGPRNGKFN